MSGYLLDTDYIVDALHGIERAVQTLTSLAPDGLFLSVITYAELYQGAYYARNRDKALAGLRQFLAGKQLVPVSARIAEQFAATRGALPRAVQQQVGDMDLLIAATAVVRDLTLVTRNLRDFRQVPNLKLYLPQSG